MALPTTITGISTSVACCGPFISSGGNVYFFGRDSTTAGQLDAMKATAPATSFSSVANTASGLNTIQWIAGYQVSDVIHLVVATETTITAVTYKYITFNMATDAFVLSETIASALNTETSGTTPQYGCSIVVRSTGEVVVLFNGARLAVMGSSWSRIYWSRRTAVNTWSAAAEVDAGGLFDYNFPEAVLGVSDAVHFFESTVSSNSDQRTLSSGNVLQTDVNIANFIAPGIFQGVSYVNGANTNVVATCPRASVNGFYTGTFTSANVPTIGQNFQALTSSSFPVRAFNDGTDIWVMSATGTPLQVAKSTDDGVTFGSFTTAFTAGAAVTTDAALSIDGNIFLRGTSYVIPYVVNDNGTLKYNEYVVRVAGVNLTAATGTATAVSFGPSVLDTMAAATGTAAVGTLTATSPVSANLLAATGTGSATTFAITEAKTLPAATATGALGSFVPTISGFSFPVATAVGTVGNISDTVSSTTSPATATGTASGFGITEQFTLPAAAATGTALSFTPTVAYSLSPATGTGSAASFVPSISAPLSAATGLGQVAGFSFPANPALTAVAGIGVAAGFTPEVDPTFAAATASSAIGNFVESEQHSISPGVGVGTVSGFVPSVAVSLIAATATGGAASFLPSLSVALIAATAVGTAASVTPSGSDVMAPATGSGTAASFVPSISVGFASASGVGQVTSFVPSISISLGSATGTGTATSFGPADGINLFVAAATGQAASFLPSVAISLAPAAGTGVAAALIPTGSGDVVITPATAVGVAVSFSPIIGVPLEAANGVGEAASFVPTGTVLFASASGVGEARSFSIVGVASLGPATGEGDVGNFSISGTLLVTLPPAIGIGVAANLSPFIPPISTGYRPATLFLSNVGRMLNR